MGNETSSEFPSTIKPGGQKRPISQTSAVYQPRRNNGGTTVTKNNSNNTNNTTNSNSSKSNMNNSYNQTISKARSAPSHVAPSIDHQARPISHTRSMPEPQHSQQQHSKTHPKPHPKSNSHSSQSHLQHQKQEQARIQTQSVYIDGKAKINSQYQGHSHGQTQLHSKSQQQLIDSQQPQFMPQFNSQPIQQHTQQQQMQPNDPNYRFQQFHDSVKTVNYQNYNSHNNGHNTHSNHHGTHNTHNTQEEYNSPIHSQSQHPPKKTNNSQQQQQPQAKPPQQRRDHQHTARGDQDDEKQIQKLPHLRKSRHKSREKHNTQQQVIHVVSNSNIKGGGHRNEQNGGNNRNRNDTNNSTNSKKNGNENSNLGNDDGISEEERQMADDSLVLKKLGVKLTKLTQNDFHFMCCIGQGSFGKVYLVRRKYDDKSVDYKEKCRKVWALKILTKKQLLKAKQIEHTRTERRVLGQLDHPFLIKMRYAFQTYESLYIVMEYANGGELFYHLKREGKFEERRAKFYTAEILLAIAYMHSKKVLYRDLKPENVLLDRQGHIKLTDFGLSKDNVMQYRGKTYTFCGTPEYLAPEVLLQKGHGRAVDWWSLGTLLYEMMNGIPPFYHEHVHKMYEKILHAPLHLPKTLSKEARSIFIQLLQRDPAKRLGSGRTDAVEIQNHSFFKVFNGNGKWRELYNKRVDPPFTPMTKNEEDTRNIEPIWTEQNPNAMLPNGNGDPQQPTQSMQEASNMFPDFTWNTPGVAGTGVLLDS